jgi:four helix bundle protein
MEKAHKKLNAWKEAMKLVELIYAITSQFPDGEKFGLVSQMRRSSVSVPSNIAEGSARTGTKDIIQFYVIARSSLSELDTQIELSFLLHFISESNKIIVGQKIETVDALLNGLIRYKRK